MASSKGGDCYSKIRDCIKVSDIQKQEIRNARFGTISRLKENLNVFDFVLKEKEMTVLDSFNKNIRLIVPNGRDGKPRDAAHPHYPFKSNFEF